MKRKLAITVIFSLTVLLGYIGINTTLAQNESFDENVIVVSPTPPQTQPPTPGTAKKEDKPKPIKDVLPDAKKIDGLITLYHKKDRLLAEIKGSNFGSDYLIAMAIAKGSGTQAIGGYTLGDIGEDKLWHFKKVDDRIHIVRRNIKYKANPGTTEALAVDVAYSDSVIYSLPIIATGEGGGDVIDFGSIFMSDFPGLGLGSFSRERSHWGEIKGFQNNIEFRVVATYSGYSSYYSRRGSSSAESVGVTIHYSISKLPSAGYSPRLADNRIGYFTTSHKNFSKNPKDDHVVRYINRWNLQKADPSATLSPPKKPVIFWISKTVPFKYRNAVREGILEWNKAFEKIGFVNAIEVRQQADNDTWDAEDINYNTFRWITSEAGFAMGPSHVNPLTGEILDADIIFDASFVESWRATFDRYIGDVLPKDPKKFKQNELRNLILKKRDQLNASGHKHNAQGNELDFSANNKQTNPNEKENHNGSHENCEICSYAGDRASQFAVASLLFVLSDENDNTTDDTDTEAESEAEADNNETDEADATAEDTEEDIEENSDNKDESDDKDKDKDKPKKEAPKKDDDKKDDAKKDDSKKDSDKKDDAKKDDTKKDKGKKDDAKKGSDKKDDSKKEDAKPERSELQKKLDEAFERFVLEGLKDVVMHEVGHTLGLRHNFKASSWLTLDEINNPKRSKEYGIAGSVMDYLAVNISPKGKPQGDYFMRTLGPYDYLAIEYGYKSLSGSTDGDLKELRAIASRQSEKGNAYAPDEDMYVSSDPLVSARDLGSRPIDFAKSASELYYQLLPQVVDRASRDGESYKDVRRFYLALLKRRLQSIANLTENVGGQYRNRDFRGDPKGRLPIQVVDAKTQRESVEYICKNIFESGSLKIPAELYNRFGEERWLDGGRLLGIEPRQSLQEMFAEIRIEFLSILLDPDKLQYIEDARFRVTGKEDVYTVNELFDSLTKTIFKELDTIKKGEFSNQKPAIDIQQHYLQNTYTSLLTVYTLAPAETFAIYPSANTARTIARQHLTDISKKIETVLKSEVKLDSASRLHLQDLKVRIDKALDASWTQTIPILDQNIM